jgi:iron complex outermembrane recepter protein
MLKLEPARSFVRPYRARLLAAAIATALITAPWIATNVGATEVLATPADVTPAGVAPAAAPAAAQDAPASSSSASAKQLDSVVVSAKSTRSAVSLTGKEIQKIQPGASPLKAIQTLPGVLYLTADPWGNNEQNTQLFVHGFSTQQLGYTMDGVPLGDQQYGNYNGLSPQRAVISEDVGSVTLASGAGDLSTASTSNLGGTVTTLSSDPAKDAGLKFAQTFGSYSTTRTYLRYDTGNFGNGNSAYGSIVNQDQRAWDFAGHQRGVQADGKFVHDDSNGKLTLFADYSDKVEPNEDSIYHGTAAGQGTVLPYTRAFTYPNFPYALAYLGANGAPPASAGNNYRNYYSDAQRTDYLTYAKYDWKISDGVTWSNQIYYHHNDGVGVVAGPIQVAGLPALFSVYYPGQNLKQVFGNSGYATRTTEYDINRRGFLSSVDWVAGNNQLDAGVWYELNRSGQYRRWYALDVNDPTSPYQRPNDSLQPLITQYNVENRTQVVQPYVSDQWFITPEITLQAGFKSSFQFANGQVPTQPLPGSTVGVTQLPVGTIDTRQKFLPQVGATWDITSQDQLFANVQKNTRQFITYGAGGLSPWSLGSQAAFEQFKQNVSPETSWTEELGLRSQHDFNFGPISGIDGQVSVYHVDFSNRLLSISPTPVISSIVGGAPIIANVGSVTTNGVDIAGTLHFGDHFSFYDALSYNQSQYNDNYLSGTTVVPTSGKNVPGSPEWLNKFILSANYGAISGQLVGDYVGKVYATYTNDLSVPSYFLLSAQASYAIPGSFGILHNAKISLNVSNLLQKKGAYEVVVGAASGTYNTYPIPPRQFFVTFSASFF